MMQEGGGGLPPELLAAMFAETGLKMGRIAPLPGVQAVFEAIAV